MSEPARKDAATGAYDERFLREALGDELSYCRRHQVPLTLVLAQLDDPATVEDLPGLARRLESSIRADDVLARYGAESFALLLRNCDARQGQGFAERLRRKLGGEPALTLGVAEVELGMLHPDELIQAAERKLQHARASTFR